LSETQKLLLEKAQSGDIAAFEELVQTSQRKIYNLCYSMMGNAQDAEDMAQEAIIKSWRALKGFRGTSQFSTWLYRIAVNTCRDKLRSYKASFVSIEEMKDFGMDLSSDEQPFAERTASIDEINEIINQLPPDMKTILVLRDIEDFSYEQIAGILKCSLGTVRSRLHRARNKFAEIYKNAELAQGAARHNGVRRMSR